MVSCKTIVAHLSEYLDGEAPVEMHQKIERHLRGCRRCSAIYDSTRKMLVITGDERVFELPAGFSERLHSFLNKTLSNPEAPRGLP
jgi:anti-sigma factor RsiW